MPHPTEILLKTADAVTTVMAEFGAVRAPLMEGEQIIKQSTCMLILHFQRGPKSYSIRVQPRGDTYWFQFKTPTSDDEKESPDPVTAVPALIRSVRG